MTPRKKRKGWASNSRLFPKGAKGHPDNIRTEITGKTKGINFTAFKRHHKKGIVDAAGRGRPPKRST